jgi:glycosyltransferase involved in cell wall biosynthesis
MPGPIDLLMATALAWTGTKFLVIVHDADSHPGENAPLLMWLQRRLLYRASTLVALSNHVAQRLRVKGFANKPIVVLRHPPMAFGALPPPPFVHGGVPRVLFFGRLLAYKGLDLLSDALAVLDPNSLEVRVVGSGPDSEALTKLGALPFVTVENRWVAEGEIAEVIAWTDALVLPYREASQSGAAAVAIAAGRWIGATDVGGLREQLSGEDLAIIVDPDAASLAGAIRRLCQARPTVPDRINGAASAWTDFATTLIGRIKPLVGERR